jgi:hypothetical protein
MAVCLVCGRFEEKDLQDAMNDGWVFTRCPECQRGTPFDILMMHLSKTIPEKYFEGFCPKHWFKDSGVCGYCKVKRRETVGDIVP